MALPRRWTDPARLTVLAAVHPVRDLARRAGDLLARWCSFGRDPRADEWRAEADYWRSRAESARAEGDGHRRRLEALARFPAGAVYPEARRLAADVVLSHDASFWRRSLTVACGSSDGARVGDWVVWREHLVGRLSEVGPFDARVQLVTSPGFKVGGRVVEAGEENAPARTGIVEGRGEERARMKWIREDAGVADGALVVTTVNPAGGMPAGLILGRIRSEGLDRKGYRKIGVEPEIRADALDAVVVLLRGEERP
jgi:rod shape-determining protein MreC